MYQKWKFQKLTFVKNKHFKIETRIFPVKKLAFDISYYFVLPLLTPSHSAMQT